MNVVGLCGVHGDYSKTVVRIARLNGSRGLRSGSAGAHRVDHDSGHSQARAGIAGVSLLDFLVGDLLTCRARLLGGGCAHNQVQAAVPDRP